MITSPIKIILGRGTVSETCELCGRDLRDGEGIKIRLEGTTLIVCHSCSKYGQIVHEPQPQSPPVRSVKRKTSPTVSKPKPRRAKRSKPSQPEKLLVENYGEIIRKARTKKKLSHADLSRLIGEPISFIQGLETEKLRPSDQVVKKLERELNINLMEEIEEVEFFGKKDEKEPTLGDIVIIKKRKNKKNQ